MKQLPVVMKMQIYLPFQRNILSPHSLKHFLHRLMCQGHTSEKSRGQGQLHMRLENCNKENCTWYQTFARGSV